MKTPHHADIHVRRTIVVTTAIADLSNIAFSHNMPSDTSDTVTCMHHLAYHILSIAPKAALLHYFSSIMRVSISEYYAPPEDWPATIPVEVCMYYV
jgi:hypothetical protein